MIKKCNWYICSSKLMGFCRCLKLQVLNCLKEWHLIHVFKYVSHLTKKMYWDRSIFNTRNLACHFPELLGTEILIWTLRVILSYIYKEVKLPSYWSKMGHFLNRVNKWIRVTIQQGRWACDGFSTTLQVSHMSNI